jgi:hypothetical protein
MRFPRWYWMQALEHAWRVGHDRSRALHVCPTCTYLPRYLGAYKGTYAGSLAVRPAGYMTVTISETGHGHVVLLKGSFSGHACIAHRREPWRSSAQDQRRCTARPLFLPVTNIGTPRRPVRVGLLGTLSSLISHFYLYTTVRLPPCRQLSVVSAQPLASYLGGPRLEKVTTNI